MGLRALRCAAASALRCAAATAVELTALTRLGAHDEEDEEAGSDAEGEESTPRPRPEPRGGGTRPCPGGTAEEAPGEGRTRGRQEGAGRTPQTEEQPRTVQVVPCQLGTATKQGQCARVGCKCATTMSGCRTCGVRLCQWKCLNAHLRGGCDLKSMRLVLSWKDE